MEKVVSGGVTEFKHFVSVRGQSIALYSRKSTGTNAIYYRHDDHLGSTEHLTDGAGSNVVMQSFGAYGQRRGTNWTGTPTPAELATINSTTRKGFTEHEMLDSTELVHMNGRVFDPVTGRFVSADPFEDCALETQGLNRYAYVGNQAVSKTDPTGFCSEGWDCVSGYSDISIYNPLNQGRWTIYGTDVHLALTLHMEMHAIGVAYEWSLGNVQPVWEEPMRTTPGAPKPDWFPACLDWPGFPERKPELSCLDQCPTYLADLVSDCFSGRCGMFPNALCGVLQQLWPSECAHHCGGS
jgi:RHS repeat-associated protein